MTEYFDIEAGKAKVCELDELEAKRRAEIRSTPNMDISAYPAGKRVYVSPKGNDTNCGRGEDCPVKSISRAISISKPGDVILLERGGLWREKILMLEERTITAYGSGRKPIISGSPENGTGAEKWELVFEGEDGRRIWKFYNESMVDVGSIFFDGDGVFDYKGYAKKELVCFRAGKWTAMGTNGEEYDYRVRLENMTFFHKADSELNGEYIATDRATGPIYLRCDKGNPGELFGEIEFNTKLHTVSAKGNNITVDNLCIVHTGSHGIGCGTIEGLTVTNCEIAWIGGSIQSYTRDEYGSCFRFGNGVEIYGGCKDYTIENCLVYQCYDAGITHQYSFRSPGDCVMDDVIYRNNVITDCVYNIEYFHSKFEGYVRTGKNILFEGNLLRRAGFGFGSTRPDKGAQGNIRSGGVSNPFENYVIRSNVFDRSVAYLVQCETESEEYIPEMSDNTYIQGVGNRLCNFGKVPVERPCVDETLRDSMDRILREKNGKFYHVEHIPCYEFPIYEGK